MIHGLHPSGRRGRRRTPAAVLLSGLILIAAITLPAANTAYGDSRMKPKAAVQGQLFNTAADRTFTVWDDRHDFEITGFVKEPTTKRKRSTYVMVGVGG